MLLGVSNFAEPPLDEVRLAPVRHPNGSPDPLPNRPILLLAFSPSWVYNCNNIYKIPNHGLAAVNQPRPKKGTKVKTQTYATETGAKKAAAMAYRPAILQLANGRYACFQAGQPLPRGARAVSRWGTNRWRAYN